MAFSDKTLLRTQSVQASAKPISAQSKSIEARNLGEEVNVHLSWLLLYISTCKYQEQDEEIFRLKQAV